MLRTTTPEPPRAARAITPARHAIGSRTMEPLFLLTERLDPQCGEAWHTFRARSKLHHLTEVVSLDDLLCRHVVRELRTEDWRHVVNEDYMLHFFTDVQYLVRRGGSLARRNLLCAFRDPQQQPSPPASPYAFRFEGYDLADVDGSTSALTNCGGFPRAFSNEELASNGLLPSLARAKEVQEALAAHYPEEPHADCTVWALFRASQPGSAADEIPERARP